MRFSVEQRFEAPAGDVAAAFAATGLYEAMPELPKLSRPMVLSRDQDGEIVRLQIRYRFDGELSSAARAVLDPSRLSWVESSTHDLSSLRGTFTMEPDHYADRFSCRGSFRYVDGAGYSGISSTHPRYGRGSTRCHELGRTGSRPYKRRGDPCGRPCA